VPEDAGPELSPRATAELLHAELGYLLDRAGIPVLHVKGPTVVRWLYPAGDRRWGDVDLWVPLDRADDALAELARHGLGERFPGVNHRTSTDHAVVLARAPGSPGGGEVDLHVRFPGVGAAPGTAFRALWRRRVADELAGTPVWFPDRSSRALLLVLNTARDPASEQARGDLARLLGPGAEVDWDDVLDLATELAALPALRAGLELSEAGRALVARTGLAAVVVTPEWRLRVAGAPLTALRLAQLGELPWRRRPRAAVRWLAPSPGVVRMRDDEAGAGRAALLAAYTRRLVAGVGGLPRALRQLRTTRLPDHRDR
jgi:hypothetical protein